MNKTFLITFIVFLNFSNIANSADLNKKLRDTMTNNNQANNILDRGEEEVLLILQNEYAVLSDSNKTKILATTHLGPCVGIVIYDEVRKIAALGHYSDGITPEECIMTLIKSIKDVSPTSKELIVHLRGGWMSLESCRYKILGLLHVIDNNEDLQLKSAKFSEGCWGDYLDLAFDVEKGEIFTSFRNDEESIKAILEIEQKYIFQIIVQFSYTPNGAYLRKAKNRIVTIGKSL